MADQISFLSYSRLDAEFALKLVKDLRQQDHFVWLDQIDLPPGNQFDREIEKILRESRNLLVILSPNSVASENVQDEIAFGLKTRKRIIPLMYKNCEVPYRIERLQYIDFTNDYKSALQALTTILSKIPVAVPPGSGSDDPRPPKKPWQKPFLITSAILIFAVILYVFYSNYDDSKKDLSRNQSQADTTIPDNPTASGTEIKPIFLGSYPLHFSSDNPLFPIVCDATGRYDVYEDQIIVTLPNIKITHLGKDRFLQENELLRGIYALSMFLVYRDTSGWNTSNESNIVYINKE